MPNAELGYAVALSGDTALASAVQEPVAFVYARSGGTWALQAILHAAHQANYFGTSVAVSGDTALVGACCNVLGRPTGAVYVFGRSGSAWTLLATILPPPGSDGNPFGQAVALNGPTAVIGGVGDFVYVGQGSTWVEQAQLMPIDRPPYDIGGTAVVDGSTALVGATGTMGAWAQPTFSCAAGWGTRRPPTTAVWRCIPCYGSGASNGRTSPNYVPVYPCLGGAIRRTRAFKRLLSLDYAPRGLMPESAGWCLAGSRTRQPAYASAGRAMSTAA